MGELCHEQLDKIRSLDPNHPRLQALVDEYGATKRKYGIAS
jgi:hypothetical protein